LRERDRERERKKEREREKERDNEEEGRERAERKVNFTHSCVQLPTDSWPRGSLFLGNSNFGFEEFDLDLAREDDDGEELGPDPAGPSSGSAAGAVRCGVV
jgi:hypothetical protein